jgi:hypothetical protein
VSLDQKRLKLHTDLGHHERNAELIIMGTLFCRYAWLLKSMGAKRKKPGEGRDMAFRGYDAALAFLRRTAPLPPLLQSCISQELDFHWGLNQVASSFAPSTPPSQMATASSFSDAAATDDWPLNVKGHEGMLSELCTFFEGARINPGDSELAGQGPGNMIAKRFV